MISIVSPIYNERDNLRELVKRVVNALDNMREEFEYILIDNGSSDESLKIIKELRKKDPRIKFLSLSRNFGHQGAIIAGLAYASGDAVISLDGDLQQPPELIPRMIELWRKGNDIVYTIKKITNTKKETLFLSTMLFYKLISSISDLKLTYGQSDYRLLDRKVVDTILRIPERNKFLRGIVQWVGFTQAGIEYEMGPRRAGRSKFTLKDYINFAFDGIFSFSVAPLRIFLWLGIITATFCAMYAILYFIMGLVTLFFPEKNLLPPGSATITVSILFLGAVQLIGIGCLGEYIGRIYTQTKERPDYIIKEKELTR